MARLFTRESDPAALVSGLWSIESWSRRLSAVRRGMQVALDAPCPQLGDEGGPLLEEALGHIGAVIDEMGRCAAAIEQVTMDSTGTRWGAVDEHYPELVSMEYPPWAEVHDRSAASDTERMVVRCRVLLTSIKDRYSSILPALPWIGQLRDSFTGTRLTALRADLEAAEDLLGRVGALLSVEVDLSDGTITAIPYELPVQV